MVATESSGTSSSLLNRLDSIHLTESTISDSIDTGSINESLREPLPEVEILDHTGPLSQTTKQTFTILLIGETGTGKTAFMSLLANILHGVEPLKLTHWNDQSKESGLEKIHSQTTESTLYVISSPDGRKFQILDTPGLADTRGIEQDNIHKENINRAIQEFVTSIDAVMILANGTIQRLNVATEYALNIISAMFPRSIIDNIGFLFTHSDTLTLNFEKKSLHPQLQNSRHWVIQNPLAMLKHFHYTPRTGASGSRGSAQKQTRQIESCYNDAVDELNDWFEWLDSREVQTTTEIDRLYRLSRDIESNIDRTLSTITRLSEERRNLRRIQSDLRDANKAKGALEELERQEKEFIWDREDTMESNTICIAPQCFTNCHSPCNMSMIEDFTTLGRWCSVFKNYRPFPVWDGASAVCKVCQHPSSEHRHYRQKHIQRRPHADLDKKQKLALATADQAPLQAATETTKRKLIEISEDLASAQDSIRIYVQEFNTLSLSRSFAGHIRSALQVLKLRKEELKTKPAADIDTQLDLIDESIAKLEEQLRVVAKEESKWEQAKAELQAIRDRLPDFSFPRPDMTSAGGAGGYAIA